MNREATGFATVLVFMAIFYIGLGAFKLLGILYASAAYLWRRYTQWLHAH